ncbi:meiosis-specific APC/C activator protein AMA1 [Arthroderma uncinatum]|uniref:meiosis-specific APC/C activator protein AMA1 n=1 Tax=Arthroderma uncinatum TaxID=74035 RepID=UPI00144A8854|nr:meiosis-specific APC/C activator protein AMA1 [Arthroderma uncinatum]KAF3481316.1 meiosis-specific APC/C activator protein AMA1 [Arthroderma uncinatum]
MLSAGSPKKSSKKLPRPVPSTPFRVLDAPLLRDDFYCSTLAYCYTARVLAVGLGHKVYIWSEGTHVQHPPFKDYPVSNHVTSLSFSSQLGGHSILAVGRHGGQVTLWSTFDSEPRFEIEIPNAVSNVCFKGRTTRRPSSRLGSSSADVEELAIGDERGQIWYYSVEWTSTKWRQRYKWNGAMVLLAKIKAHTQQICGMAWSPDGRYLATGGNDNFCLLFDTIELIRKIEQNQSVSAERAGNPGAGCAFSDKLYLLQSYLQCGNSRGTNSINSAILDAGSPESRRTVEGSPPKKAIPIPIDSHKHKFLHAAAVKAIAFSPWQPTLLATGGGTNDRCIRFYHATSGACLAIINVYAQVTSLIWSKTRREIAATFGYASPEHPYRIAVFAWPSCQQVVAIPWSIATGHERYGSGVPGDCGRALWAISYPGGPNEMAHQLAEPPTTRRHPGHGLNRSDVGSEDSQTAQSNREGDTWWSRTAEEGCIIVASSDESVKFHEVWSGTPKSIAGTSGLLGGSAILEGLEGIEKETEVIR